MVSLSLDGFCVKNGVLFVEGISIFDIVLSYGTPIYCYSANVVRKNYLSFAMNFPELTVCFALKANSNLSIVNLLAELGGGADVVSGGELNIALSLGIPPSKIVFSGVGKQDWEIVYAIRESVQINIESLQELTVICDIARGLNLKAKIALRFNPDIDALTHAKITTGLKKSKFGLSEEQIFEAVKLCTDVIDIVGISIHIGSQIFDLSIFERIIKSALCMKEKLRTIGINVRVIDLGGGLGVDISGEKRVPQISGYMSILNEHMSEFDGRIIIEPGRAIVADAGILLSQVVFTKNSEDGTRHVIIDAGMNDFVRSAMYNVKADALNASKLTSDETLKQSISGPVCESSDCFNAEANIPVCERGDIIAICAAGAYGSSMSSTYNSRPITRELLVDDMHVTQI